MWHMTFSNVGGQTRASPKIYRLDTSAQLWRETALATVRFVRTALARNSLSYRLDTFAQLWRETALATVRFVSTTLVR